MASQIPQANTTNMIAANIQREDFMNYQLATCLRSPALPLPARACILRPAERAVSLMAIGQCRGWRSSPPRALRKSACAKDVSALVAIKTGVAFHSLREPRFAQGTARPDGLSLKIDQPAAKGQPTGGPQCIRRGRGAAPAKCLN